MLQKQTALLKSDTWRKKCICGFSGSLRSGRKHESPFSAVFYFWGNTRRLFCFRHRSKGSVFIYACFLRVPSWHLGEELFLQENIINFIPLHRVEKFSFPALPKANLYSGSALPSFFRNTIKRQGGEMDRHRVHVHYLEKQSCVSVNNDCFWKKKKSIYCFYFFWWTFWQSTAYVRQDRMKWWPGRRLTL